MRKISISPIQNQVLRLLEEAGSESERTVIATLRTVAFDEHEFGNALKGLERLGYIRRENDLLIMTQLGYAALSN